MAAVKPGDIARALNAVDAAWKAVRRAVEAEQMLAAAHRAAGAESGSLPVKANAEVYEDSGEIIIMDDIELEEGDLEVVELELDVITFARVMDAAADSLNAYEQETAEEADRLELDAQTEETKSKRLREQYDFFSGGGRSDDDFFSGDDFFSANDEGPSYEEKAGGRYGDMLPPEDAIAAWEADQGDAKELDELLKDSEERASELWERAEWLRSRVDAARSEAARKRRSAKEARTSAAVREVEAQARHEAAAAIAKARKRVTAAALGHDTGALSDDRMAEMLGRFADLIGSDEVQRLSDGLEV